MAQQPEWHESALGLRVARHLSRRVFPVDSRHPVTAGLDEQDLRDWAGQSTLVESHPDYGTENHLPPYGWRWGNRGALTSGAIEKPAYVRMAADPRSRVRPGLHAADGTRLRKGRLVWCALDLEDYVPTDPAAVLLAQRIVEYSAKAPLSPRASSVVYLGDAAGASQLEAIGVAFNKLTQLPAPDGLAIIGGGRRSTMRLCSGSWSREAACWC
jgi:beta-galactosidase